MFKTAIINNQPLLPKQIKYKLNQKDTISECSFQTLRLYEPYNLETEQEIPVYIPQKYYWAWSDVKIPNTEEEYLNQGIPYLIVSGTTHTGVWINDVEIPTKKIAMMPPTEEEYRNQEKRIFTYEYVILKLTLPFDQTTIRQTVTYVVSIRCTPSFE
jgi:hypothetical protein